MTRRNRRGGNAIEFAFTFPVLLAVLTATIDYGWYTGVRIAADTAARQGARAGALTAQDQLPNTVAVDTATLAWANMGLPATPTIVAFRQGTPETMVVRVQVNVPQLVGLVAGPSTIESTVLQLMEDQP